MKIKHQRSSTFTLLFISRSYWFDKPRFVIEGKLLLATSTPSLGAPPNSSLVAIKLFSGAVAGDLATARGVSYSQCSRPALKIRQVPVYSANPWIDSFAYTVYDEISQHCINYYTSKSRVKIIHYNLHSSRLAFYKDQHSGNKLAMSLHHLHVPQANMLVAEIGRAHV